MKKTFFSILFILFIFIGIYFLASPIGEFPLNDDWARTQSVKYLLEDKKLRLSHWTTTSFVGQVFYGYAWSKLFGFSFTNIRLSVLFLSFIAVVSFYLLLKELKFDDKTSLAGSLLLLFNPLFFIYSYIFMSDVPFAMLIIISSLFYLKALSKNSDFYLTIATLLAGVSILLRQNGLAIPAAVFFYLILAKKLNLKRFFIITVIPAVFFIGFYYWYFFIHGPTFRYLYSSERLKLFYLVPFRAILYSFLSLMVVSLYGMPFMIINYVKAKKRFLIFFIMAVTFSNLAYFFFFNAFSYEWILSRLGLGPYSNSNYEYIPFLVWNLIGAITILSAATLLYLPFQYFDEFLDKIFSFKITDPKNIVYFVAVFQLLWIFILPGFFDKYLLPVFPALIIILLGYSKKLKYLIIATIIFTASFSLIATTDLFNFNKAKWHALSTLADQGISTRQIDGGFEFNGWYNGPYLFNISEDKVKPSGKSGKLFVDDDTYTVATFVPIGYEEIDYFPYPINLGKRQGVVFVSKRV